MATPSLRDVLLNPEWIPHTFDVTGATLTFVHVPKAARADLMFLSDEHFAGNFDKIGFPVAEVAAAIGQSPRAPLHLIFHSSFCCSTLFANALDVAGTTTVLKEPDILINVANRLIRSDDQANRQRLELVLRLLERPFAPGEAVIVKPSNFGNRLVETILALRPQSKAVLLYSDVRTLLTSLLKRGMWGRIWGRRLFWSAGSWTSLALGYDAEQTFVLPDLQALALGWLMQMRHFSEVAQRMGDRVAIVDSADFLADPGQTLRGIVRLFDLGIDDSTVEQVVSGPTFARHSKFSERGYGPDERAADQGAAQSAHEEELEMVVKWVERVAAHLRVGLNPASSRLAHAI